MVVVSCVRAKRSRVTRLFVGRLENVAEATIIACNTLLFCTESPSHILLPFPVSRRSTAVFFVFLFYYHCCYHCFLIILVQNLIFFFIQIYFFIYENVFYLLILAHMDVIPDFFFISFISVFHLSKLFIPFCTSFYLSKYVISTVSPYGILFSYQNVLHYIDNFYGKFFSEIIICFSFVYTFFIINIC
jgi:hypothetical protein